MPNFMTTAFIDTKIIEPDGQTNGQRKSHYLRVNFYYFGMKP